MTDRFGLLYDSSFDDALRNNLDLGQDLDFFEIIPDRYIGRDEAGHLLEVLKSTPTVFHSLNLSLGSDEPLDRQYMNEIASLAASLKPMWASDHMAITRIDDIDLGNLSPVRFDLCTVERIAEKVSFVQEELQVPFLVENIAYYFSIPGANLSEAEFLNRLVEKTGCGVLLDLNNITVNAKNHGFDPLSYLEELPLSSVQEIHIAGHRIEDGTYVDSHGEDVAEEVWDLLRFTASKLSTLNVILERDQNVPSIGRLIRELSIARKCVSEGRLQLNSDPGSTNTSVRVPSDGDHYPA